MHVKSVKAQLKCGPLHLTEVQNETRSMALLLIYSVTLIATFSVGIWSGSCRNDKLTKADVPAQKLIGGSTFSRSFICGNLYLCTFAHQ
ncbi:hypothetical protein TNCV_4776661 [Trichonephila clavipes]|nr:hypothetical protein TNCV_4776661 [Trichonephila clavipes]